MTADNKNTDGGGKKKKSSRKKRFLYSAVASIGILAGAGYFELRTSFFSSAYFNQVATGKRDTVTRTTSPETAPPAEGPYDERVGYTQSLHFRKQLSENGYQIKGETTWQEHSVLGLQLHQIYKAKPSVGLQVSDHTGTMLYDAKFPRQAFDNFDAIPPMVAKSLLYVEDRNLLEEQPETWNPAFNAKRFANAALGYGLKKVGIGGGERSGGSTLATQIEKFRHSPDGVTGSPKEKIRQLLTASVRHYSDGRYAVDENRSIVLDYLNSMPLSSYPGYGEVTGYGEGMMVWFNKDPKKTAELLMKPQDGMSDAEMREAARAYRDSLALVMSVKKPSAYLRSERAALEARIDSYLPLLVEAGIITPRFREFVMQERITFRDPKTTPVKFDMQRQKAVDALRVDMMQMLDVKGGLYSLDRLDMAAKTTVDGKVTGEVTKVLKSLTDPEVAKAKGLTGFQLLKPEAAGSVIYAFTLYEKMPDGTNVLRVQTDNFGGQLNLNEGTKLELGSTSKLRTLVSYLEAFAFLHEKYNGKSVEELKAVPVHPEDNITRWALDYLADPATDKSLKAMLEGALDRKYSGSPGERFFTGGGLHAFENFEPEENVWNKDVRVNFHHSVNLAFIRMMRDIVYFTMTNKMGVDPEIFTNPDSEQRRVYLEKFADKEGQTFLWRAWTEQKDKTPEEIASMLADKGRDGAVQNMVIFRSMFPDAPYEEAEKFLRDNCEKCDDDKDYRKQYEQYGKDKFDLNDRAYLTSVHPLALWLASYRIENPKATWKEVVAASADTRVETYEWLMNPRKFGAQNTRIRIMLEEEAFTHIHKTWKALGYPFEKMVPSYASALGSSGDTPAALSELSGIIQNDGMRKRPVKFSEFSFASKTPYAMEFNLKAQPERRVLPAEVTQIVRREMQGVVQEGTGRRLKEGAKLSDGRVLPIGGKTGTGDNRLQTFAKGGAVKSSDAKNRTGTFVYSIDDRFFGCVTAYVDGPEAAKYKFTSGLAVQVLKTLLPTVQPVLDRAYDVKPPEAGTAPAPKQTLPEKKPANDTAKTAPSAAQKKPSA